MLVVEVAGEHIAVPLQADMRIVGEVGRIPGNRPVEDIEAVVGIQSIHHTPVPLGVVAHKRHMGHMTVDRAVVVVADGVRRVVDLLV